VELKGARLVVEHARESTVQTIFGLPPDVKAIEALGRPGVGVKIACVSEVAHHP
jgi:hypothetical protein